MASRWIIATRCSIALVAGCQKGPATLPGTSTEIAADGSPAAASAVAAASATATAVTVAPTQAELRDAYGLPPPSEESQREVLLLEQQHAQEEHERRLRFDQRKMNEHRAVVTFIVKTRSLYDHMRSKAAMANAKGPIIASIVSTKERVIRIDPWGNNSYVASQYGPMLDALANQYPAAVVAFLDGDEQALAEQRARLDAQLQKITEMLKQAETVEAE